MKREVVYTASRELYRHVAPSIKSLLATTHVDKVYLYIEDDELGERLPDCVEVRNASSQGYYPSDSPNMTSHFTYLAMIRAALHRELPDSSVVLSLDCDTFCNEDIGALWDTDLTDVYFSAAKEPQSCWKGMLYTNTGVALYNLDKLRDGKGDEVIRALNWRAYANLEQDVLNFLCQGAIHEMNGEYNACEFTEHSMHPKLVHFAGVMHWWNYPLVEKWREADWTVK